MSVSRYRKKPVVIEAVRWDGTNIDEVLSFLSPIEELPNLDGYVSPGVGHTPALGTLDIPTLEGVMTASPGAYVIRGAKGEFYPCKPDIFAATYEPAASSWASRSLPESVIAMRFCEYHSAVPCKDCIERARAALVLLGWT